ncbi:MAG: hypothetical protein AAFP86_13985, partial [Planctomycetota bacterium]
MLLPSGGPSYGGGGAGFPWFLVNPVEIPPSGSVTVGGLPRGPVSVRVFHRGARVIPAGRTAHLDPGRTVSAEVDLEPGASIVGRVVDANGPVADAFVTIEAANQLVATTRGIGETNPRATLGLVLPRIEATSQAAQGPHRARMHGHVTALLELAHGAHEHQQRLPVGQGVDVHQAEAVEEAGRL